MCNTLNIKALELYCNIKKWNIELDTLFNVSKDKMRKALREKVSTDYAFANTKCTEIASRLWLCQKPGATR